MGIKEGGKRKGQTEMEEKGATERGRKKKSVLSDYGPRLRT